MNIIIIYSNNLNKLIFFIHFNIDFSEGISFDICTLVVQ